MQTIGVFVSLIFSTITYSPPRSVPVIPSTSSRSIRILLDTNYWKYRDFFLLHLFF